MVQYWKNMKKFTYKMNKYPEYTFEHFEDISHVTNPELVSFIQDCFINCYEVNDVDIIGEDYDYRNYLKDMQVMLTRKGDQYLSFATAPFVPSCSGLNLTFYMPKTTDPALFESLAKAGVYFTMFRVQDIEEANKYLYFDTNSTRVHSWCKELIPSLQMKVIKKYYMVCYTPLNKDYIKNVILKDCEVTLC